MSDSRPFTAASFNAYLAEGKLMASYCPESDSLYLPPRAICPKTHSTRMEWRELSGKGKIAAFTAIYIGLSEMVAAGYDRTTPYFSGIVALDEGVTISAFLLGLDAAELDVQQVIGAPVTVEFWQPGGSAADGAGGDESPVRLAFKRA